MAVETFSSEALVSFLLEMGRVENAPKTHSRKTQCCQKFLSLFDEFDLGEFSGEIEKLVEKHIRLAEDASNSHFERIQALALVTGLKLGSLRILEWLFAMESGKCRKFIRESEKVIEEVFKSVSRAGIEDSSSLSSVPDRRRPVPKRNRRGRSGPQARVAVSEDAEQLDENGIEEVMSSPEQHLEEPASEDRLLADHATSAIAHVSHADSEPSMLEFSDMGCEEGFHWTGNGDGSPAFQLEPLSENGTIVPTRNQRRRRVVDSHTELSTDFMRKSLLESGKLSRTVEENRLEIANLRSKLVSASELLGPGPNVGRGQVLTNILRRWFKRPRLERPVGVNRCEGVHEHLASDDSDDNLHGLSEMTDDRVGASGGAPMHDGQSDTSVWQEVSGLTPRGTSAGDVRFDSGAGSSFDDQLEDVHALVLRNANRFLEEGNSRLRYACLSEISRCVERRGFPALFKCLLMLCDIGRLYMVQPPPTSKQIFIFPTGQSRYEVS